MATGMLASSGKILAITIFATRASSEPAWVSTLRAKPSLRNTKAPPPSAPRRAALITTIGNRSRSGNDHDTYAIGKRGSQRNHHVADDLDFAAYKLGDSTAHHFTGLRASAARHADT